MSLRYTGPVAWMARHGVAPNLSDYWRLFNVAEYP